ncbi:hypothetical protein NC653_027055 [Populus alba x Populus x berolinensis]|uniref:Protein kinase domain-containing protein n=1 Tax=Populus alba x Populus x berolinensis TaxID=444605 RepID=A0AAD6M503_9ROSI|nr:hypothetical protein NC653_027055 [Populus alba x Populus x berolinensis]
MAPEYAMAGLFSVKSDVFSFGVLLLEMISGKKNVGFHLSEEGESLLTFAWKLWSDGQGLELMDPMLEKSSVATEVLRCIHIGLLCVQEDPADRPTMSSVLHMLASDTITLPIPKQPAFSIGRFVAMEGHSSNQKTHMHLFLRRKEMSIPGSRERKPVVMQTSSTVCVLCFTVWFLFLCSSVPVSLFGLASALPFFTNCQSQSDFPCCKNEERSKRRNKQTNRLDGGLALCEKDRGSWNMQLKQQKHKSTRYGAIWSGLALKNISQVSIGLLEWLKNT